MKKVFILFIMPFMVMSTCYCDNGDVLIDSGYQEPSNIYIVVFGDIQYLTNRSHVDIYKESLNWIDSEMKKGRHINCILHTGDVTENNKADQWDCFLEATTSIASQIPFISLIGNHDYTWEGSHITDRNSTLINNYIKFPLTTQNIVASFEEGHMENIIVKNEIYGKRYDLLLLEFGPRPEVVKWAEDWVASHPDIRYILMNHEYLEKGGGIRTKGLKCKSQLQNTNYLTPNELWEQLIKRYDNILCVLCGHVGGLYATTIDKNEYGRDVCQIQHNIQSSEFRYDNWLMIWDFPSASDSVSVSIVNAKTGQYYDNQKTLFKFRYRDSVQPVNLSKVQKESISPKFFGINGIQSFGIRHSIQISEEGDKVLK